MKKIKYIEFPVDRIFLNHIQVWPTREVKQVVTRELFDFISSTISIYPKKNCRLNMYLLDSLLFDSFQPHVQNQTLFLYLFSLIFSLFVKYNQSILFICSLRQAKKFHAFRIRAYILNICHKTLRPICVVYCSMPITYLLHCFQALIKSIQHCIFCLKPSQWNTNGQKS